jgi:succinyl-CoA synthetase beta subunit
VDFPEHHAKRLLADAGLPVPRGGGAAEPDEAAARVREVGGPVVVKAQVPAGGRGKAGGVRFADTPEEAAAVAADLLGTTVAGFPVAGVLVEERIDLRRELYAAILDDAASRGPLVLFSTEGGIDIEEVHATAPEKVIQRALDIREDLSVDAARELLEGAELDDRERQAVAGALAILHRVYREVDAGLVEVNPLAIDAAGEARALDCKLAMDDGARARHPELVEQVAASLPETGTELERRARELGLFYIELDGDIGVLANGAGLTMTTMDVISHYGGAPANFLEIGGDAYTKATPALRLALSNPKVRSLVVNFCGAFARTDVMAEGVVNAIEELRPELPISFSIHGTGEDEAIALVRERLGLEPFDHMDDAVVAAIGAARDPAAAGGSSA